MKAGLAVPVELLVGGVDLVYLCRSPILVADNLESCNDENYNLGDDARKLDEKVRDLMVRIAS